MREDAEVGLPLLKLTATDEDDGDNGRVHFMLCSQPDNSSTTEMAAVSVDTGWLTTAATLDYETVQQVPLGINKQESLANAKVSARQPWTI